MKLKYRLYNLKCTIIFAFYPKTTIIFCSAIMVILDMILGLWMSLILKDGSLYNVLFAVMTGVTASFIVSVIIECAGNHRRNKQAFFELDEYHKCIRKFIVSDRVKRKKEENQKERKLTVDEFATADGRREKPEFDRSLDVVQVVWEELPKLYLVLTDTYKDKKAFLTENEIYAISFILDSYQDIRFNVKMRLDSLYLVRALNAPDQDWLNNVYQKNILVDSEDWMLKRFATKISENSIDSICDMVMGDRFLLHTVMGECDISLGAIEKYNILTDMEGIDSEFEEEEEIDDDYGDDDGADLSMEEFIEFKKRQDAFFDREQIPFVSWQISHDCLDIYEKMMILKSEIRKKPYIGLQIYVHEEINKRG